MNSSTVRPSLFPSVCGGGHLELLLHAGGHLDLPLHADGHFESPLHAGGHLELLLHADDHPKSPLHAGAAVKKSVKSDLFGFPSFYKVGYPECPFLTEQQSKMAPLHAQTGGHFECPSSWLLKRPYCMPPRSRISLADAFSSGFCDVHFRSYQLCLFACDAHPSWVLNPQRPNGCKCYLNKWYSQPFSRWGTLPARALLQISLFCECVLIIGIVLFTDTTSSWTVFILCANSCFINDSPATACIATLRHTGPLGEAHHLTPHDLKLTQTAENISSKVPARPWQTSNFCWFCVCTVNVADCGRD